MPPGNRLNLSSSSACNMRVPILVETEISSSVILRFSRSSFSFSPKDGKPVSRLRRTEFYSVEKQDHSLSGSTAGSRIVGQSAKLSLGGPGAGFAAGLAGWID